MRTDKPPFNDARVHRASSHAVDRQAINDSVFLRGKRSPGASRGLPEWSPRIDQLELASPRAQPPRRPAYTTHGLPEAEQCPG